MSRDAPIVQCIEREYYLKETKRPIKLEPHQKRILNAAFMQDANGEMPYSTVIYSCVKKSGKTELGAAITYAFLRLYGGECYSIANDLEQAKTRMFDRIFEMLKLMRDRNPDLYEAVIHPDYEDRIVKGNMIRFADDDKINPGPHTLQSIPQDYRGEAGGMPALTMWDELWGFSHEGALRLWTEMQPIPTLPISMRLVTTYAGFYGESDLLYRIFEACVDPDPQTSEPRGERVKGLEDLPCYKNDETGYFCYWDEVPRMPWHTEEFLEKARKDPSFKGREQEYLRIWKNQWITGLDAFLPMEVIDQAINKGRSYGLTNHFAA